MIDTLYQPPNEIDNLYKSTSHEGLRHKNLIFITEI